MTYFVFILFLGLMKIFAALVAAFSLSRKRVISAFILLTITLFLSAYGLGAIAIVFWVLPAFIILDLILLSFIFSSPLLQKKAKEEDTMHMAGILGFISFFGFLSIWGIWSALEIESAALSIGSSFYKNNFIWKESWPLVLLCLFLITPVSIGSFFMASNKE